MERKKETEKTQIPDIKKKSKKDSENNTKELEKKIEELKNNYVRTLADFDNYRKRKEKETIEARERAIVDFVLEILPSIDNFEMSLKMTDNKEMFIKGVEMIHKNLIDTLKSHHFEEFEPQIGHDFDPYTHEPVLIEDKQTKPGKIISILKKGYKYKEKIVRPAKVQVTKEKEE